MLPVTLLFMLPVKQISTIHIEIEQFAWHLSISPSRVNFVSGSVVFSFNKNISCPHETYNH